MLNNTLKKANSKGASISPWRLFDKTDVEYAINWDGSGYKHVSIDGKAVGTWNQEIAEGVFKQLPASGVSILGGSLEHLMNFGD